MPKGTSKENQTLEWFGKQGDCDNTPSSGSTEEAVLDKEYLDDLSEVQSLISDMSGHGTRGDGNNTMDDGIQPRTPEPAILPAVDMDLCYDEQDSPVQPSGSRSRTRRIRPRADTVVKDQVAGPDQDAKSSRPRSFTRGSAKDREAEIAEAYHGVRERWVKVKDGKTKILCEQVLGMRDLSNMASQLTQRQSELVREQSKASTMIRKASEQISGLLDELKRARGDRRVRILGKLKRYQDIQLSGASRRLAAIDVEPNHHHTFANVLLLFILAMIFYVFFRCAKPKKDNGISETEISKKESAPTSHAEV